MAINGSGAAVYEKATLHTGVTQMGWMTMVVALALCLPWIVSGCAKQVRTAGAPEHRERRATSETNAPQKYFSVGGGGAARRQDDSLNEDEIEDDGNAYFDEPVEDPQTDAKEDDLKDNVDDEFSFEDEDNGDFSPEESGEDDEPDQN